jgi:hypothetical protein
VAAAAPESDARDVHFTTIAVSGAGSVAPGSGDAARPPARRRLGVNPRRRLGVNPRRRSGVNRLAGLPLALVEEALLDEPGPLLGGHLDVVRRQQEDLVGDSLHPAIERIREPA